MSKKYLLGATIDKEIVFAEFGITTRNGYPEFSASFDCVEPFTEDEVDAEEYYQDFVEQMDAKWKWETCERYDLAPSELVQWLMDNEGSDPQSVRDCSLYPEIITVNEKDYYFESSSCGQHDTRGEMEIYTSQNLYDRIHFLWDKCHLKEVNQEVIDEVEQIQNSFADIDEEEWIRDYIRINFE